MQKSLRITPETIVYECYCDNEKHIRVVFDGGYDDRDTVEYCQKCFDQEDNEFMISMEELF